MRRRLPEREAVLPVPAVCRRLEESDPVRQLSMCEGVQWVVAANEGAVRLDTFLATRLQPLPRRDIAALIASGQVLLNGRTSKKGLRVHAGDTVTAPVVCSGRPSPALPIAVADADDPVVV